MEDRCHADKGKELLIEAEKSNSAVTDIDEDLARICAGCKREIRNTKYLGCMGTFYHPECFRCHGCGYPITEDEVSLSGKCTYHKSCFKERIHPKCDACHEFDDGPCADKGKEELLIEADKSNSDKEDLARICAGCKREIGNKNYLGCMGTFFHPECCHCHECGYPITKDEFFFSGKYVYHKSCIKKRTHPKCDVCHQLIPEDDILEYKCHPILSQMYCPSHEHDNTARCCSCQRLESWNTRYISLEEGRRLCLECMESAIMDTDACQPLYHAIRDFYEGMNMRIDQQIPVLLVETQVLNDAIKKEKHVFKHSEARGLCLYEEQTVTTILRRPRMESHGLEGIRRQPLKVIRRREVTAILVLYGFPRLLTGAILAHELMHAWLRLKGYQSLMPDIEEGICQVASYMWLESEVARGPTNMTSASTASSSSSQYAKPSIENKLGEFFLYQIANMASPDYGGGFRAAQVAVSKYGFRRTLDHIRLTGDIPL